MTKIHTHKYKTGQKGRGKHPLTLIQWWVPDDGSGVVNWPMEVANWPIISFGSNYIKIETYLAFYIDGEEQWRINANETYEHALERWGKHAR